MPEGGCKRFPLKNGCGKVWPERPEGAEGLGPGTTLAAGSGLIRKTISIVHFSPSCAHRIQANLAGHGKISVAILGFAGETRLRASIISLCIRSSLNSKPQFVQIDSEYRVQSFV